MISLSWHGFYVVETDSPWSEALETVTGKKFLLPLKLLMPFLFHSDEKPNKHDVVYSIILSLKQV